MLRIFLVIDDYNELIYLQTLLKKLGFDVESLQNQRKYADLSLGFNPQILVTSAFGSKVDGVVLARSIHKRGGLPKIVALVPGGKSLTPEDCDQAGINSTLDSPINPKKLIVALASLGGVDEVALLEKYSKMKGTLTAPGESTHGLSFDEGAEFAREASATAEASQRIEDELRSEPSFTLQPTPDPLVKNQVDEEKRFTLREPEAEPLAGESGISAPGAPSLTPSDPARAKRFEVMVKEVGPLKAGNFDRDRIREFNKKIRSNPLPDDIHQIETERQRFVKSLFKR